jgi:hypothetical protein
MKKIAPGVAKNLDALEAKINDSLIEINRIREECILVKTGQDLEELECKIIQATDKLAGALLGQKIQNSIINPDLKEEGSQLTKAFPMSTKNQGPRDIDIQSSRGESFTVSSTYISRKGKRRKKSRAGFYPELVLLGIHDRFTPKLASDVSLASVSMSSFEEAAKFLADRGINLGVDTIRNITIRFAQRAKVVQRTESCNFGETVDGRRVVCSTDGGRIRIRTNKRGPKTKKGRTRYFSDWREPKLLIIYVVNDEGRMQRQFCPFIDGTMKGPDAVFGLLKYYLSKLGLNKADQVLFVADGARWIWNRVPEMLRDLGVSLSNAYELVDFYHAVEHLGKVAACRKTWSGSERKRWVKKHRKLLKAGKIDRVITAINSLCRGRLSKDYRRERDYFVRNRNRMNYRTIAEKQLPIGSGAMESAIRRVVNLRLKGPGIYWCHQTAEAMLMLRSYFKSGRWNMLKNLAVVPILEAKI